jgi:hypothetical protein
MQRLLNYFSAEQNGWEFRPLGAVQIRSLGDAGVKIDGEDSALLDRNKRAIHFSM